MAIRTLRDVVEEALDLRVMCCSCQRVVVVDARRTLARFERRGWPLGLREARSHFRCRRCPEGSEVILAPASNPEDRVKSWPGVFHAIRAVRKRRKAH